MRLPRVRFTVRRLMAAVAVAALLISAYEWRSRMQRLSIVYHLQARNYRVSHIYWGGDSIGKSRRRLSPRESWAVEMETKWINAAAEPWLPVEPDTPCPD